MVRTRVGYTGGTLEGPTYHRLGDHTEAFQVDYEPEVVSYAELLALFWSSHRPERAGYSRQYRAAVFFHGSAQQRLAVETRDQLAAQLGRPVLTSLLPLDRFYLAEDYHQKYYLRRHPVLLAELRGYDEQALLNSTVAARLNGYVGGGGRPTGVERLGLSVVGSTALQALTGG